MPNVLRLYFLGFYGVSLLVFLVKVVPASLRVPRVGRRARGFARALPPVLVLLDFVLRRSSFSLDSVSSTFDGCQSEHWACSSACMRPLCCYGRPPPLDRFLVPQAVVR